MDIIFSEPDSQELYNCLPGTQAIGQTKLIKWVLLSKTCPDIISNIKNLLETDPDTINKSDSTRCTALMVACGNFVPISVIQLLLDYNANTSLTNDHGRTALMVAVSTNNYQACELLVPNEIDAQDELGYTAVYIAASKNYQKICELLIKSGCDVRIPTNDGDTAAMVATQSGNQDLFNTIVPVPKQKKISPYEQYIRDKISIFKQTHPDKQMFQLMKLIGEEWLAEKEVD